jgi:PAS domain S-box-containing protein
MESPINAGSKRTGSDTFVQLRRIRKYGWIIAVAWTGILAGSFTWYYGNQHKETESIARAEARSAIGRDMLYRRWAASHGGVYVPVTVKTPPNPYLSHIPERDISTASGRRLTLVNPAYMSRQVYDLIRGQDVLGQGHITSLNPLRPENAPDPWEAKALRRFETGVQEVMEVQMLDGKPYMRLMRPVTTDATCLKCHAIQGYREEDVRGGVSISIPIQSFLDSAHEQILGSAIAHGVIWALGIGMIGAGSRNLSRSVRILRESEQRYRMVSDFTSDWEYWISPDDTFIYVSPSCKDVCGYHPDEFFSNPLLMRQTIHPEDRHLYDNHLHHLTEQGTPKPIDFRIIAKNGETRWISHVCQTVYDDAGGSLGQRASNRDITERKRAEDQLHRQAVLLADEIKERTRVQKELVIKQVQLEEFNQSLELRIAEAVTELRQKDQLLIQQGRLAALGEMINNIAHQWRQPLNNVGLIVQNLQISYASGTLTKEEMDKEVASAMGVIMHMSHTIDDFRNFFRPEKEKRRFSVNKAVAHALGFISASLISSGIQVDLVEEDAVVATGHQNEYSQVLLNILSNACDVLMERKIAEPRIRIAISRVNGRSVVLVSDNGGGIAEEVLPKIFDPYFTTKEPGKGTGIGLYMSKAIIEQSMDGSLAARNVSGGAEFRIEV